MCTSIISNRNKTIVGWNLDLLDMQWRVTPGEEGVFIEVLDQKEGWMPLFGANRRGDFVGMPTCWPFDKRSDPKGGEPNIILLDIDLLLMKKMLEEAPEDFDVDDCFRILREVSQTVCPTVVSMVYDLTEKTVYWCTERQWDRIEQRKL